MLLPTLRLASKAAAAHLLQGVQPSHNSGCLLQQQHPSWLARQGKGDLAGVCCCSQQHQSHCHWCQPVCQLLPQAQAHQLAASRPPEPPVEQQQHSTCAQSGRAVRCVAVCPHMQQDPWGTSTETNTWCAPLLPVANTTNALAQISA